MSLKMGSSRPGFERGDRVSGGQGRALPGLSEVRPCVASWRILVGEWEGAGLLPALLGGLKSCYTGRRLKATLSCKVALVAI